MKNKIIIIFVVILFTVGLLFILYPTFSNLWNDFHQSKAISKYIQDTQNMDDEQFRLAFLAAKEYNNYIATHNMPKFTKEQEDAYNKLLNIGNDGIMGYIEVPKINIKLPIYHGTSDEVLQFAIGHMAGSSLPIGGESTHTILLGHRGLPSAKLFTSLDKMEIGDIFYIYTLKDTLAYKVDEIRIVEPEVLDNLKIIEGEDYTTLVTCTPYGINSHRLLVRGKRIPLPDNNTPSGNDKIITICILLFVIVILILGMLKKHSKKQKTRSTSVKKKTVKKVPSKKAKKRNKRENMKNIKGFGLLIIMLLIIPLNIRALEKEMPLIDVDRKASISITVNEELSDTEAIFNIYKVATINNENDCILTDEFSAYPIACQNLKYADDYRDLANTLTGYVKRDNIEPLVNLQIENGTKNIDSLDIGLYLIMGEDILLDDNKYQTTPVLVSLPNKDFDDSWNYDLNIYPKYSIVRNNLTDKEVSINWLDRGFTRLRSDDITIELISDDNIVSEVKLNKSNNWKHIFQNLNLDNKYYITIKNIDGYTIMVSDNENEIIINAKVMEEAKKEALLKPIRSNKLSIFEKMKYANSEKLNYKLK